MLQSGQAVLCGCNKQSPESSSFNHQWCIPYPCCRYSTSHLHTTFTQADRAATVWALTVLGAERREEHGEAPLPGTFLQPGKAAGQASLPGSGECSPPCRGGPGPLRAESITITPVLLWPSQQTHSWSRTFNKLKGFFTMGQNPPLPGSVVGAGDRARNKSKPLPSPCWVLVCPCSVRTTPSPAPLSTQQAPPSTTDMPALCGTEKTRGWHNHGPPGAPVQGLAGHQGGRHARTMCDRL